jgi:hypothetical protein
MRFVSVVPRRYPLFMRPAVAIAELEKLKAESVAPGVNLQVSGLVSWKARVRSVLAESLGGENSIVLQFDNLRYKSGLLSGSGKASLDAARFVRGLMDARGLIDAGIYELKLKGGDEPVDEHAYDPELWAHVKQQVEDGEWGKVASLTAIFVENHVRTWAGSPKDRNGNELVGKALYLEVFSETSDYRLGAQANEREGWRYLGMGFASALGNVDRHRIQKRDDAKRYALGVLGLGSLLLTQMRFEHDAILKTA